MDSKESRQRAAFWGVGLTVFGILMVPSVIIDLGAFFAGEVKMPLLSLMLIEAGAYLPVGILLGLVAADDTK